MPKSVGPNQQPDWLKDIQEGPASRKEAPLTPEQERSLGSDSPELAPPLPKGNLPKCQPGSEGVTLKYPSDDGGAPPEGGPGEITLKYPSDDGGSAPEAPPPGVTLKYPSDDGGFGPECPPQGKSPFIA